MSSRVSRRARRRGRGPMLRARSRLALRQCCADCQEGREGRAREKERARKSARERARGERRDTHHPPPITHRPAHRLDSAPHMPLLDSADPRPVHFVGIAGAGMCALAELFVRRGVRVTGCDANPSAADDLRRLGIIVGAHDPSHVNGARALVVTSAMPKDHPELQRARECGIPVIRRAEALGEVTRGREVVGIAGTHGKTTTTVMTTEALAAAGREPTALVGGRVGAWSGNLRAGADRLYVVEADEYDRSFLALPPTVAVVTNIEADHLDIYRDIADIRAAFGQFVSVARTIVVCADDPGAAAVRLPSGHEVV